MQREYEAAVVGQMFSSSSELRLNNGFKLKAVFSGLFLLPC